MPTRKLLYMLDLQETQSKAQQMNIWIWYTRFLRESSTFCEGELTVKVAWIDGPPFLPIGITHVFFHLKFLLLHALDIKNHWVGEVGFHCGKL